MGDNHQVDGVHAVFGKSLRQLFAALVRPRVDENLLTGRRGNQHRVRLAHVKKTNGQLLRLRRKTKEGEQGRRHHRK